MADKVGALLQYALKALERSPPTGALTAYHFSPYKFDRFDMSKLGTGEGNHDFGRGMYLAEDPAVVDWYKRGLGGGQGYRYKVNVGAPPERFLDWDAYLKDQGLDPQRRLYEHLYDDQMNELSRGLNELGSPGIRYFDSRSRKVGAGTRNYVVGDDKLLNILGNYAHGGLV